MSANVILVTLHLPSDVVFNVKISIFSGLGFLSEMNRRKIEMFYVLQPNIMNKGEYCARFPTQPDRNKITSK